MKIEVGKVYNVEHYRKGSFTIEVTKISEEWIDGEITLGKAKMLGAYDKLPGDRVSLRRSFCNLTPL